MFIVADRVKQRFGGHLTLSLSHNMTGWKQLQVDIKHDIISN